MALIGSHTKQPGEKLPVDIDYSEVVGERTVDSISTAITVPSGITKDSDEFNVPDLDEPRQLLQIYVSGGTDGEIYRFVVVTDITIAGKLTRVEDEFDVLVEEVSNVAA